MRRFAQLAPIGVSAATIVVLATRHYGVNISPDSTSYLAAAEGLARGNGIIGIDGDEMSLYAPGMAVLLALPASIGDADYFARWFNAGIFGVLVIGVGMWLQRYVRFPVAAATAALVAVSPPLLTTHLWVWSEPLFIPLSLTYLVLLVQIAQGTSKARRLLIVAAVVAAAATLARYSGVSLLPIAACVLLGRRIPLRRRLTDSAIFGLAFTVPVIAWLARNVLETGTATGERYPNAASLLTFLRQGLSTVAGWYVPESAPTALLGLGLLALTAFAAVLALALRRRRPASDDSRVVLLLVVGGYILLAFAALVVLMSRTNVDPLNDRLLAPLVVPALVAVAAAFDLVADRMTARASVVAGGVGIVALGANPLALSVDQMHRADQVTGAYNKPAWQNREVRALVTALPKHAQAVSNQPGAVHYLTGRPVEESPRRTAYASTATPDDLPDFTQLVRRTPTYLVWFGGSKNYHEPPSVLGRRFELEVVARTTAGKVYVVKPRHR